MPWSQAVGPNGVFSVFSFVEGLHIEPCSSSLHRMILNPAGDRGTTFLSRRVPTTISDVHVHSHVSAMHKR